MSKKKKRMSIDEYTKLVEDLRTHLWGYNDRMNMLEATSIAMQTIWWFAQNTGTLPAMPHPVSDVEYKDALMTFDQSEDDWSDRVSDLAVRLRTSPQSIVVNLMEMGKV